jgi:hypothetical protein
MLNCSGNLEIWNPWNADISELDRENILVDGKQMSGTTRFPVVLRRRESIIYAHKRDE